MNHSLFFALIIFFTCQFVFAQHDSLTVVITLKNNTYFTGHIEYEDSTSLIFLTTDNIRMEIPRKEIESIRNNVSKSTGELYAYDDPNDTRLFFAPTSRTLKHSSGYIADYWIFFPFVAVGISDMFILSGGITIIPGADRQLFYLAPKVGFYQGERLGLAGGILYMNTTNMSTDGFGIAYGVSTFGDSDVSGTIGLGWAYSGEDVTNKPILLLGGEARISQSLKLISENWIFPDTDFSLISFGVRFFGKRLATDLAFMYPLGADTGDGWPFFPWMSFAYNF